VPTNGVRFVYDGNVVIQERDGNNLPQVTLTRGRDLSGSLQGGGGIGGLLALTENPQSTHSFYHADGNGNVAALLNTNQILVAKYEYDPFGNTLSISGSKAFVNRYRFSSKPIHELSGMYDFLRRWYAPEIQRWLNGDPIGESGGLNVHLFVGNEPMGNVDLWGHARLSLTFEFGGKGDPNEPSDAIFAQSANDMLEAAKKAVGKYDPEGKDCNCIGYLVIAGHGGGGGEIPLGNTTYSAATYETNLKMKAALPPDAYDKYLNEKSWRKDVMIGHEILAQLASLKCKSIRVVVLACNAGEGEWGKALREQLANVFGPNATIVTYEGPCGFSPFLHNPVPKWDPFSWSKKKETR
jgi:RHS repeat-associated protein